MNKLTKKDLLCYGILAMPLAFAGIPIYIHAPDFYATNYGVPIGILGVALLFLRFIDAFFDLFIGFLSDKYVQHRTKIILGACLLLVLSFYFLFNPFFKSYRIWFVVFVFLSTMAFSILMINLNTLGGLWSKNKDEKTLIAGYREGFGLIGLILAVTLPSLFQTFVSKQLSFTYVSFGLFLIMLFSSYAFYLWQRKHSFVNHKNPVRLKITKDLFFFSHQIKSFFLVYGLSIFASSIPAVLILFFIRDILDLESYTGLFLLVYFLAGIISLPLWVFISRKLGKSYSWFLAMFLGVISFVWAYFLGKGEFFSYLVICILSGKAFGAELALPTSILADHIQKDTNENIASWYFGILAFLSKATLALASALSLLILDLVGFKPAAVNTTQSLFTLSFIYAILPCIIKLLAIGFLWKFMNEKNLKTS